MIVIPDPVQPAYWSRKCGLDNAFGIRYRPNRTGCGANSVGPPDGAEGSVALGVSPIPEVQNFRNDMPITAGRYKRNPLVDCSIGFTAGARSATGRKGHPGKDEGRGVVHVVMATRYRYQGVCTCEWTSRLRYWRAAAVIDALSHAAEASCDPGTPLVIPSRRGRRREN